MTWYDRYFEALAFTSQFVKFGTKKLSPAYADFALQVPARFDEYEVATGQILVDRRKSGGAILLADSIAAYRGGHKQKYRKV